MRHLSEPLNGMRRSEYLEMNLFNAASFPVKAYICFLVLGDCICRSAQVSFQFHAYLYESLGTSRTQPRMHICLGLTVDDNGSSTENFLICGPSG